MLKGDKVLLRAVRPDDLERYIEFLNDIETQVLAGGALPRPVPLPLLQARYRSH